MNSYEKFKALIDVINANNITWDDLARAGITRKDYSELEMAHLKEIEAGTYKEDSQAFEEYKREFLKILNR